MPSFERQLNVGSEKRPENVKAVEIEQGLSDEEKIESRLENYIQDQESKLEEGEELVINVGQACPEVLHGLSDRGAPIGEYYELIGVVLDKLDKKKKKYNLADRLVHAADEWRNRKTHIEHTLPIGDRD